MTPWSNDPKLGRLRQRIAVPTGLREESVPFEPPVDVPLIPEDELGWVPEPGDMLVDDR